MFDFRPEPKIKSSFDFAPDVAEFAIEHPDLNSLKSPGGLFDVEPSEMDLNIGKRGVMTHIPRTFSKEFNGWIPKFKKALGKEPFTVLGVQKNYKGDKCYRIAHDSDKQKFGRVLNPIRDRFVLFPEGTPEEHVKAGRWTKERPDLMRLVDHPLLDEEGNLKKGSDFSKAVMSPAEKKKTRNGIIADLKRKPKDCTCKSWPFKKLRNGSTHGEDCPEHKRWLEKGGFSSNRDFEVETEEGTDTIPSFLGTPTPNLPTPPQHFKPDHFSMSPAAAYRDVANATKSVGNVPHARKVADYVHDYGMRPAQIYQRVLRNTIKRGLEPHAAMGTAKSAVNSAKGHPFLLNHPLYKKSVASIQHMYDFSTIDFDYSVSQENDDGLADHNFTGVIHDPDANVVRHFVAGQQVPSSYEYAQALYDNQAQQSEGDDWKLNHPTLGSLPLKKNSDGVYAPADDDEGDEPSLTENSDKQDTQLAPKEDEEEEVSPLDHSYNSVAQSEAMHGPPQEEDKTEEVTPKGESQHTIGDDAALEEVEDEQKKESEQATKELSSGFAKALTKLPENAKSVIRKNAPNVLFFSDPAKLTKELAKVSPEIAQASENGEVFHGAIVPPRKQLLLAKAKSIDQTADIRDYELAKASADGRDQSSEWKAAIEKDKPSERLSAYATTPERAWGMFGVLVNGKEVSGEELTKAFPTMTAVWQGYGLIPPANKKPLVELVETFKPQASIAGKEVQADSALDLKEAALATFSRIGRQSMDWLRSNTEHVGDWAKTVLSNVPPPLRLAATGMLRTCYYHYFLANQIATNVAKARGMDEDKAKLLAKSLTATDAVLGFTKLIPVAAGAATSAATGSYLAGLGVSIGSSFLPVGSLAYIVLAGTRPGVVATYQRAAKTVSKLFSSKKATEEKDFAGESKDDPVEILSNHISGMKGGNFDRWLAYYLAAMDQTQGNTRLSCETADNAHGGDGGASFSGDGPDPSSEPPKPALSPPEALAGLLGGKSKGGKAPKPAKQVFIAPSREVGPLGFYSNLHDALRNDPQEMKSPHEWRMSFAKTSGAGYTDKQIPDKETQYKTAESLGAGGESTGEMVPVLDAAGKKIPINHHKEIIGNRPNEKAYLVKNGQADALGLEDFFAGKDKVSKADIKAFLDSKYQPYGEVDQNKLAEPPKNIAKKPPFDPEEHTPLYHRDLKKAEEKKAHLQGLPAEQIGEEDSEYPAIPGHEEWIVSNGDREGTYDSEDEAEKAAEKINRANRDEYERDLRNGFDIEHNEAVESHKINAEGAQNHLDNLIREEIAPRASRWTLHEHPDHPGQGWYVQAPEDDRHSGNNPTFTTNPFVISERLEDDHTPENPRTRMETPEETQQRARDTITGTLIRELKGTNRNRTGDPDHGKYGELNRLLNNIHENEHLHDIAAQEDINETLEKVASALDTLYPNDPEKEQALLAKFSEGMHIEENEEETEPEHYTVNAPREHRSEFRNEKYDTKEEAEQEIDNYIESVMENYNEDSYSYYENEDKQQDPITDPEEIRAHYLAELEEEIEHKKGLIADARRIYNSQPAWRKPAEAGPKYEQYKTQGPFSDYNEVHVTAPGQHLPGGPDWHDQHNYDHVKNPIVRIRHTTRTDSDGKKNFFVEEWQGPSLDIQKSMPPHLANRIFDIGVKRALTLAAESGAERFSFTTGNMQRERYNLRQVADRIEWHPGTGWLGTRGTLKVYKDGSLVKEEQMTPDELSENVGADLSKHLMTQERKDPNKPAVIEGKDFEMGGLGHIESYDKMIPSIVKALTKKEGGRLKEGRIRTVNDPMDLRVIGPNADGSYDLVNEKAGAGRHTRVVKSFEPEGRSNEAREAVKDRAWAYRDDPKNAMELTTEPVWSLDLTPEIKKRIEAGFSDFSEDEETLNGVVDFAHDLDAEFGETTDPKDPKSKRAAANSRLALFVTRQTKDPKLIEYAALAHQSAKSGSHKYAALNHSYLMRAHKEKKHSAAAYAHEIAYGVNSELGNPQKPEATFDKGGRVAPPFWPTSRKA